MRTHASNRSLTPKLRSNTLHLWLGDQSGNSDALRDICGYSATVHDLNHTNSPTCGTAFGAVGCRIFNGSSQCFSYDNIGADSAATDDTVSVMASFALSSSFATEGTIINYCIDASDTADVHLRMAVDANRNLLFSWSVDGIGEKEYILTEYTLTLAKWYQVCVVRDVDSNSCKFYINGELIATKTAGWNDPIVGGDVVWYVGAEQAGGWQNYFNGSIASIRVDTDAVTADEVALDFRRAMLWDCETAIHQRIFVTDHDANPQNMTSFLGNNWINSVEIEDDSDSNCVGMTVKMQREIYNTSVAKYHSNRANLPADYPPAIGPTDTYNTDGHEDLLDVNRQITQQWARVPLDSSPQANDWVAGFDGYIDTIEWAGDEVVLQCRDLGSLLLDAYIEETTQFPTNSTDHQLAATIYDGGSGHGIIDKAVDAGWIATNIELDEPVASGISITTWMQDRSPILDVIGGLAEQIGWRCRFRWGYAQNDFRLTLYAPSRTQTWADACFSANDYVQLSQLKIDKADIRNVVQVVFSSSAPGAAPATASAYGGTGVATGNQPGQYYVRAIGTDVDASYDIARYRRLWCEINEGDSTNITTYAQAEAFALSVLRDLMNPTALLAASLLLFPECETEDMFLFQADGHHTTVDLRLAAFLVRHSYGRDRGSTELTLRGKPSGGSKRHLSKETRTSGAPNPIVGVNDLASAKASRNRLSGKYSLQALSTITRSNSSQLIQNPDFINMSFGTSACFDGWTVSVGTWGSTVDIDTANSKLGGRALELTNNASYPVVMSNLFPVSDDMALELLVKTIHSAAGQTSKVDVAFYTDEVGGGEDIDTGISKASAAAWTTEKAIIPVPSGIKFARIKVYGSGTGTNKVIYDVIDCKPLLNACYAKRTTGQSINKSSDPVKIQFNVETYDAGSVFDNATNYRYTANADSIISIYAAVVLGSSTTDAWTAHMRIIKNGYLLTETPPQISRNIYGLTLSDHLYSNSITLLKNDYLEFEIIYDADYSTATVPDVGSNQCDLKIKAYPL